MSLKFPFPPTNEHGDPDSVAQLILADWCEDQGEEDIARALRWCAIEMNRPYLAEHDCWFYWFSESEKNYPSDLPPALYRLLNHKANRSEEEAYKALGKALKKFAEKDLTSSV